MGAIKDLVDLVTQLSNSVEDRKFAGELRQIQSMIGGIQSEHAAMHEQRINLMSENAELKQTNASLCQKISSLEQNILNLQNRKPEPTNKLHEEAEKILKHLFETGSDVRTDHICHQFSLDKSTAKYHLENLEQLEMTHTSYFMGSDWAGEAGYTTHSIIQKGRKYVIDNLNR